MYCESAKIKQGATAKLSEMYISKTVIYYSSEFRKFLFNCISSLTTPVIITKGSYKKEPICDELAFHSYNVYNIIL